MTTSNSLKFSNYAILVEVRSYKGISLLFDYLKGLGYKGTLFGATEKKGKGNSYLRFVLVEPKNKSITVLPKEQKIPLNIPIYKSAENFIKAWLEPCVTVEELVFPMPPNYGADTSHNFDDSSSPATATELLDSAKAVQEERGKEYDQGKEERNMGRVIEAFNAIHGTNLTEAQGWHFMSILKAVRLFSTKKFHSDSAIDLVSYASLTGEAKSKEF